MFFKINWPNVFFLQISTINYGFFQHFNNPHNYAALRTTCVSLQLLLRQHLLMLAAFLTNKKLKNFRVLASAAKHLIIGTQICVSSINIIL
jgi:hypothetical protein